MRRVSIVAGIIWLLAIAAVLLSSCAPRHEDCSAVRKRCWGGSGFYRGELRLPRVMPA